MRTTIELPDELLSQVKIRATLAGVSLKQFFVEAIEQKLSSERRKTRRSPPSIGDENGRPIGVLSPEQIDEAMFG